jgi:hypothetical protein
LKSDITTQYLNTIDYGYLPIRYCKTYLDSKVIDTIEDSDGEYYEVRRNQNGKLVAILSN